MPWARQTSEKPPTDAFGKNAMATGPGIPETRSEVRPVRNGLPPRVVRAGRAGAGDFSPMVQIFPVGDPDETVKVRRPPSGSLPGVQSKTRALRLLPGIARAIGSEKTPDEAGTFLASGKAIQRSIGLRCCWRLTMKSAWSALAIGLVLTSSAVLCSAPDSRSTEAHDDSDDESKYDREIRKNGSRMIRDGREIFRYDTFGDEEFWGDELRLHEAIAAADNGGVGPGVSPSVALAVGLKVDIDALPKKAGRAAEEGAGREVPDGAAQGSVEPPEARLLP
jgi:hypothetical protein